MAKSSPRQKNYPFAANLGSNVRIRRKQLQLTQQELGDLAEVGVLFVSQLERGKQTVRLDKLMPVLNVLGLELKLISKS